MAVTARAATLGMIGRRRNRAADEGAGATGLAQGLRRGDPDALTEIHRTFGAPVLGYLRAALGDHAQAEDVHQDVFLEVWRRGSAFDPDRGSLGTWIMLIARSRALDHRRKRIPEPVDPLGPRGATLARDEDPGNNPDTLVERWRMAVLIAQLPEEQARILRMRFHEGFSQSEIATRTGIPLGTVKTYMVRGLRRLRQLIEEGG